MVYFFTALIKHEIRMKYEKCIASVSYFVVYFAKLLRNANYEKYIASLRRDVTGKINCTYRSLRTNIETCINYNLKHFNSHTSPKVLWYAKVYYVRFTKHYVTRLYYSDSILLETFDHGIHGLLIVIRNT